MKIKERYHSELILFGVTTKNAPQIRKNLFTEIHEIVYHGKGGYSWSDVYSMPTWLRKYTFQQIKEFLEKQNEQSTKSSSPNKKTWDPSQLIKKTSYK